METVGKIVEFLVAHQETVVSILGALGLLKWFQSDSKKRAQTIMAIANDLFDVVERVSGELGLKGIAKWAGYFDLLTAQLRLAGIELRESEIRRVEKLVQTKAKITPHLNITPLKADSKGK